MSDSRWRSPGAEGHRAVRSCLSGLPEHPAHALAGARCALRLDRRRDAGRQGRGRAVHRRVRFVRPATSSGLHTSAERRARWGTRWTRFIRLSVGCEPLEALWGPAALARRALTPAPPADRSLVKAARRVLFGGGRDAQFFSCLLATSVPRRTRLDLDRGFRAMAAKNAAALPALRPAAKLGAGERDVDAEDRQVRAASFLASTRPRSSASRSSVSSMRSAMMAPLASRRPGSRRGRRRTMSASRVESRPRHRPRYLAQTVDPHGHQYGDRPPAASTAVASP